MTELDFNIIEWDALHESQRTARAMGKAILAGLALLVGAVAWAWAMGGGR